MIVGYLTVGLRAKQVATHPRKIVGYLTVGLRATQVATLPRRVWASATLPRVDKCLPDSGLSHASRHATWVRLAS